MSNVTQQLGKLAMIERLQKKRAQKNFDKKKVMEATEEELKKKFNEFLSENQGFLDEKSEAGVPVQDTIDELWLSFQIERGLLDPIDAKKRGEKLVKQSEKKKKEKERQKAKKKKKKLIKKLLNKPKTTGTPINYDGDKYHDPNAITKPALEGEGSEEMYLQEGGRKKRTRKKKYKKRRTKKKKKRRKRRKKTRRRK